MGRGSCVTEGHSVKHSSQLRCGNPSTHQPRDPSPAPFTRTSALPSLADEEASDPPVPRPTQLPIPLPTGEADRTVRALCSRGDTKHMGGWEFPVHLSHFLRSQVPLSLPGVSSQPKGQLSARIMSKAFLAELPVLARRPRLVQNVHGGCTACTSRVQDSPVPLCLHREQLVSHYGTAPAWTPKYHSEVAVLLQKMSGTG